MRGVGRLQVPYLSKYTLTNLDISEMNQCVVGLVEGPPPNASHYPNLHSASGRLASAQAEQHV